jgi:hypothetical protein
MMRKPFLLLALCCSVAYAQTAAPPAPTQPAPAPTPTAPAAPKPGDVRQNAASLAAQAPAANPNDVSSPDAIVAACYSVISGPAGERNWDRFRSLFVPNARLSTASTKPDGSHTVALLSVDDYVRLAGKSFTKEGFFENGIHNDVRTYGNISQIFTSYESRHAPAEKPFQRGINSFQMLYDGQRWWVVSILWDDERADNPLPPDMAKQ